MAHRSDDDVELVRSGGSPLVDEDTSEKNSFPLCNENEAEGEDIGDELVVADNGDEDANLPQCKIKRNYSCNLCPFFSQNPRSFLYHSRDVHFDRIKIYECSYCLYASKHSQKLQRHIKMIHVAGKNRLKRGTRISTKDLRPIMPKPLPGADSLSDDIEPTILGNISPVSEDESEIEEIIDGEFKCSLCSYVSKNQNLMRRHERIVHLKKRFMRCSKCSYMTHVKARYTKHVKYHSMPMIKCDLCDFRTPYKWNLDRHYKNHCGSGAFQCSKCNFRADIKQSLTVHEMNHHVPPVGQGAVAARKKNKVGGSESSSLMSDGAGKEMLEMEVESSEEVEILTNQKADSKEEPKREKRSSVHSNHNVKSAHGNKREAIANSHLQADFIHPDDIVPRYGQIFVKNLKCKFCSYKAVFSHEIWRHEKRIHGYVRPENKKQNAPKRPPPKLIPIQNKVPPPGPISSPILKIPEVKNKSPALFPDSSPVVDKSVNENEFNEMCKKSCLTSSLKDFVSLIGDEEGLKTIPDSSREDLEEECSLSNSETIEDFENKANDLDKQKQTDLLKKKNASFFDKLKEKLLTGSNEEQSLFCEECAHESKCLSEAVAHQKRHSNTNNKSEIDGHSESDVVVLGVKLSSTRCQHCRQRCKTSTDLFNHLKSCKAFGAAQEIQTSLDEYVDREIKCETDLSDKEERQEENETSMENRVFVWNDLGRMLEDDEEEEGEEDEEEGIIVDIPSNEDTRTDSDSMTGVPISKEGQNADQDSNAPGTQSLLKAPVKNVFKCPHCSFWASTASRFHVHIVGHLNKKPFECSLCMYRSNWRWDITKHIRLKSARDPSHLEARVNMTDETGRRNYSKYSKYLTLMKVQEPSAESSGTGRRSKPNDVTQGNVIEKDVITLPALPRLTRAPTPGTSNQVPEGLPLRPPPPLKAAHQISPNSPSEDQSEAPENSKKAPKKTLWKCKRCDFRDSNKNNVLSHVKQHYGRKKKAPKSTSVQNSDESSHSQEGSTLVEEEAPKIKQSTKISFKEVSYKCGHCQQTSPWKHVIQRHCRLKHNGNALIEVGWRHDDEEPFSRNKTKILSDTTSKDGDVNLFLCDICPFTTDSEGNLTAHKLNHVDRPGSIFKCTYCPFYVPSKIAVLEHMQLHGVFGSRFKVPASNSDDVDEENSNDNSSNEDEVDDPSPKFSCKQCPFASDVKTQFLFHKKLHVPRNTPYKCKYCSYNVTRPHILREHLKIHSIVTESTDETPDEGAKKNVTTDPKVLSEIEQVALHDIPLVWVFKSKTWKKMFKCRHCPHLNARKTNIQEHEKMHQEREKKSKNDSEEENSELHCEDCNYACNNAGVLASHIKVHQDDYGIIGSLVDRDKSDAEQIKELQNSLLERKKKVSGKVKEEKVNKDEPVPTKEAVCQTEQDEKINKTTQNDFLSSQPENAYRRTTNEEEVEPESDKEKKILSFCDKCPARFFFEKERQIHSRFHCIHLPFRCVYCTYTARQRPHLLAHYSVHSQEYKEKTEELVTSYEVSKDCPRPQIAEISNESRAIEGPVWMVTHTENATPNTDLETNQKNKRKFSCNHCPATFFKLMGLKHHQTLHGVSHRYKCKYCDYSVRTQGNLTKHLVCHEGRSQGKSSKKKDPTPPECPPRSARESLYRRLVTRGKSEDFETSKKSDSNKVTRTNPQMNALILGSSDFIYPTYLKHGKVREKRYKCQKCPSAFEKRDQYRVHNSLHGSKQKYECEKCDYAVKYYANFSQHMKKHEIHEQAILAKSLKTKSSPSMEVKTLDKSSVEETSFEKAKNNSKKSNFELTLIEQQTLMLQERKMIVEGKVEDRKVYNCRNCPYVSDKREKVTNHSRRHFSVSGIKSQYGCPHCDYSSNEANFLRDHIKIHFGHLLWTKPEAFLKCHKMELWCSLEKIKEGMRSESSMLVFQDKGGETEDRFFPPIPSVNLECDGDENCRMYIDPATGQPIGEKDVSFVAGSNIDACYSFLEAVQLQVKEMLKDTSPPKIPAKPKTKRSRGKNWKCKKCPHAFGKKDQYMRHISLHGSNQKHNCDICDYSVKFYTNYVQHMRMHQTYEPDKLIILKKNGRTTEENASKRANVESKSAEPARTKKTSEAEVVKSEFFPEQKEKLPARKYEETDQEYSSFTDGTEMSVSSEDGNVADEDEHVETKTKVDGVSVRSW